MRIDKEKIAELAAMPDDALWAEIVRIGASHGFNMPKDVPPHDELEKLRGAVTGEKMRLGDAMKILNGLKRGRK